MPQDQRRLAAIMFTDMADYTSLSQRDEKLALRLLESQDAVLKRAFGAHNGRVVKGTGDGYLVEFGSALEAMESAVDAQKGLSLQNAAGKPEAILRVRIGIHVGDVVEKGEDIFGDAVNIASRTFPMAEPGGVCITEEVYSQVRNKIPLKMEKLAPQQLKHVDFPVNLYKVVLREEAKPGESKMAPKNRLAVLPLTNISPDAKDSYLADGMTEELITVLSKVQGLRVIARTSSDRYRGSEKRISSIGDELEVGVVMEGSIRRAGEKIRVTVQLIDAQTEEHLWAETYDRELTDVFSIQSEIARDVADALKLQLLQAQEKQIEKRATSNLDAYMAYLKGRAAMPGRTKEGLAEAIVEFERAAKLDPTYAPAYAGLSDAVFLQADYKYVPLGDSVERATEYAKKALALDPDNSEAHASMGLLLVREYRFADAEREYKRAIELNPSYAPAHHWYGMDLAELGKLNEGLEEALLAERQDPLSLIIVMNACGMLFFSGRIEEARKLMDKARHLSPGNQLVAQYEADLDMARNDYAAAALKLEALSGIAHNRVGAISDLAYCYAQLGQRDKIVKLEESMRNVALDEDDRLGIDSGIAYALGDMDKTFDLLSKAIDRKAVSWIPLRYLPQLEGIRKDPRWAEMLKKYNFPLNASG
ncbi:MAG: hypothetical protein HY247_06525 [archaeon]|nr:MAG: hypothetical protein HY247_06525 [archaeon]